MSQQPPAFFSTGGAVPVMEGYLPGAARNNRLSINNGENTETTRRQREASMKESTRRRESAAKGESRRFSFMSSSAEFNKLLIESLQNGKGAAKGGSGSGKGRKPRADKRNRLSSGTFCRIENQSALLSTYINADKVSCGKTGLFLLLIVGAVLFVIGFALGMGFLPMMVDDMIRKKLIVSADGPCFAAQDGGMCPGSVQSKYFLWNITNPNEYLQGAEPPRLEEVGPFVYNTYEKVYHANFVPNKTVVEYEYTYFWNYSAPDSCAGCEAPESLDIFTVNSAYLQVLDQAGGSETSLIMAFLPQIFDGLFQALRGIVALSADPAATEADLDELALSQWANCSALGASVASLPAYQESDPYVPELGAWKSANVDNSSIESGVSADVARKIFSKQVGSPAAGDFFPDAMSFIGGMLMMPEATFAAMAGMPEAQVAVMKGYLYYVVGTYGTLTLQAAVGPALGDQSSGLLVKRSAKDLLEGWQDPLLAAFAPGMNLSYNLGFHTDLIDSIDAQMASGLLNSSHPFVFAKEAKTGQYDPSEIGEVVRFGGQQEMQHGNGTEPVRGLSMDPASGFRFYNFRHATDFEVFHEGVQRPLTFMKDDKDSVVHKIDALHFSLDPNETVTCGANATQCLYADNVNGAWNASSIYMAPTLGSFPHWSPEEGYGANDIQLSFNAKNRREWGYDIEPRMGIALRTSVPFQYNYLVAKTDVLHPAIWTPSDGGQQAATASGDGVWIPQFYYDLMAEISAKDAFKLRKVLNILKVVTLCLLCVLPTVGIIMVVYSTFKLFFSLETIERNKMLEERLKTRASTVQVNRESMLRKAKNDVEKQGCRDPLNRHHYSFNHSPVAPKSSIPGYNK